MRRGAPFASSWDEVHLHAAEAAADGEEMLSFQSAPLLSFPQGQTSPLSTRPRSTTNRMPQLTAFPGPARSPLLGRGRSDRPTWDTTRVSPNTSTGAASQLFGDSATPGALTLSPAPPSAIDTHPLGRWLSTEPRAQRHSSSVVDGDAPVAAAAGVGPSSQAPQSPLLKATAPLTTVVVARTTPPRSWRTLRLTVAAFCVLNGSLAFLFAWMMATEQAAFVIAAEHRGWDLADRAAATRLAGVYYGLLGLILFIDRASAVMAGVLRGLGRGLRGFFTTARHGLRRCAVRVHLPAVCAPLLLRRCTRRVSEDETAQLLPSGPLHEIGTASHVGGSVGESGVRELGPAALRRSAESVTESDAPWRTPAPMKIRRRGN